MPTYIELGLGNQIVGHVVHGDLVALVFTQAPKPGEPGADATGAIPSDQIADEAIVLRFRTPQSVFRLMDSIKAMVQEIQRQRETSEVSP